MDNVINMQDLNIQELSLQELNDTDGGVIIALAICCFAAGVAIGILCV